MTYKEFDLPYGNSFIKAKVPEKNISFVLSTKEEAGIPDEAAAITAAMRSPTGSQALAERLRPSDKVVVLVTDNTRACPEERVLPPVLAELERKVPRQNITIIICLGQQKRRKKRSDNNRASKNKGTKGFMQ